MMSLPDENKNTDTYVLSAGQGPRTSPGPGAENWCSVQLTCCFTKTGSTAAFTKRAENVNVAARVRNDAENIEFKVRVSEALLGLMWWLF